MGTFYDSTIDANHYPSYKLFRPRKFYPDDIRVSVVDVWKYSIVNGEIHCVLSDVHTECMPGWYSITRNILVFPLSHFEMVTDAVDERIDAYLSLVLEWAKAHPDEHHAIHFPISPINEDSLKFETLLRWFDDRVLPKNVSIHPFVAIPDTAHIIAQFIVRIRNLFGARGIIFGPATDWKEIENFASFYMKWVRVIPFAPTRRDRLMIRLKRAQRAIAAFVYL